MAVQRLAERLLRRHAQRELAGRAGEPGHHAGGGRARQALSDGGLSDCLHQPVAPEVIAGERRRRVEGVLVFEIEDGPQPRQQRLRLGMGRKERRRADAECRGIAGHGAQHQSARCRLRQRRAGDVDGNADHRLALAPGKRAEARQHGGGRRCDDDESGTIHHRLIVRRDPAAEALGEVCGLGGTPGREQDLAFIPGPAQAFHHEAREPAHADDAEHGIARSFTRLRHLSRLPCRWRDHSRPAGRRLFIDNRDGAAYEPCAHTPWRKPLKCGGVAEWLKAAVC